MRVYLHLSVSLCLRLRVCICMCLCIHVCACVFVRMCVLASVHVCMHMCVSALLSYPVVLLECIPADSSAPRVAQPDLTERDGLFPISLDVLAHSPFSSHLLIHAHMQVLHGIHWPSVSINVIILEMLDPSGPESQLIHTLLLARGYRQHSYVCQDAVFVHSTFEPVTPPHPQCIHLHD